MPIGVYKRKSIKERFFEKVDVRELTECWTWKASVDRTGYGRFYMNGKGEMAHRASWWMHNGEIPEGMLVLHHCDNPPCVNPTHLFLGTHQDNAIDRNNKGRNVGNRKLTDEEVIEIRKKYIPWKYSTYKLASEYGVSQPQIGLIVNNKTRRL